MSVVVNAVESPLSNSATVYTLGAGAATNSSIDPVTTVSVTLNWMANGNPSGTYYQVQTAQNASFVSATNVLTTSTLNASTGLLSNDTYYLHVRAQNGDGFTTAYDATQSTITPAAVPVNGSFVTVTGSTITIAWGASTNITGTVFQAELSTISAIGTAIPQIGRRRGDGCDLHRSLAEHHLLCPR